MKILNFLSIYVIIAFSANSSGLSAQSNAEWPVVKTESKPWTRWWWMGSAVDKKNLTYNLESLSKAGIGGVEITPIYGVKGNEQNNIEYLSPAWMEMLEHTLAESKRLGMDVDMNTGTGWPFGGREVSVDDAATKALFQSYKLLSGQRLNEKILAKDEKQKAVAKLSCLMAYDKKGNSLDITSKVLADGTLNWTAPKGSDWDLVALFVGKTFQKVKRAAPGGQGYVLNHLDKEAVKRYLGKFDGAFARNNTSFPHSFFNDSYEVYGADWTPDFLHQFEKRRGYKLELYFREFLDKGATDASARIVSDYRETIGDIVKENFSEVWTDWAHTHGSTTRNQAHGSPANLIDIYASVDVPECESFGITDFDIPLLRKDSIRKENDGDPTTLKYASSAAHIAGKPYTSSETFTWLTEHFRTSLSQCKPELDQMFVSGVNRVFFHGNTYSPKEAAWPGWLFYASVDMSPKNTIWKDAPAFFDYIARTQSFLQEGMPDNDFLLYLPIYDIWNEQRGNHFLTFAIHGMRKKLPEFYKAVENIRSKGYDLDYVSDHFIQTATVENGLLKTEGGATYKALILPAVNLIPTETLAKIQVLIKEGATVVFAEKYPDSVPGFYNLPERQKIFSALKDELPSFNQKTEQTLGNGKIITGHDYNEMLLPFDNLKEVFITDFGGQLVRRKASDGYIYFFTMLQNRQVDAFVPLSIDARSAVLFDPMTGQKGKAILRSQNGKTEVLLQLQPGESIILKTFSDVDVNTAPWTYFRPTEDVKVLSDNWILSFDESEPMVNKQFNLSGLGSWTDLPDEVLKKNMGTGKYKNTFVFSKKENSKYRLCLGDVRESAKVYVNGQFVSTLFAVPFEVNIGNFLNEGENTIEIEVTNLPANRIADYDRRGVEWRIFEEINFVSLKYKDEHFDHWHTVPSGLLGPVTIKELRGLSFDDSEQITIHTIGDSTMANKEEKAIPETGWGQVLQRFFNDKIRVINYAKNGRSTKSFINGGLWDKVLPQINKGDYVFIQFGHNDEKVHKPSVGTTLEEFEANLTKFISEARERGATPILLTPITRRTFNSSGILEDSHQGYPETMKKVAKEHNVPLIDMHKKSMDYISALGVEESKNIYLWVKAGEYPNRPNDVEDNTHFSEFGAVRMASLTIEGLKELNQQTDLCKAVIEVF